MNEFAGKKGSSGDETTKQQAYPSSGFKNAAYQFLNSSP